MFSFRSYQINEIWSMQLATIRAEIERMRRQQIGDGRIAEPLDTDAAGQAAAHRSVRNIQRRPSRRGGAEAVESKVYVGGGLR